ncbi:MULTISPECIES: OmpA family protein [unclassified Sphingopyxis]|jgi:outer membrane protein OmpA-like peptidoglycan-associated protein|uniref:OmpA family protein n=1 Tax=unclassified Sphingopyxis TaxID=2614943 RepID=UPI0025CC8016|nr:MULTISPECIES: OmpA family protein [unclassified Sphingopyxis]
MTRRALALSALALAACAPAADSEPPPASEASAAPAPATPAPANAPGGMTGSVSNLTGDISGLNVRVTDMGTIIDLAADALFEFDKADLTPAAEAQLQKAAALIRKAPPGGIQVIGHTDAKGDDAYNQRLSEARARTVADWFARQVGVRQRDFAVSGKGETAPIAPNETATGADDPAGRTKNRRVEVILPR